MDARRGFTLVELIIVILILGILAAVAAPRLFGVSKQANEASLRQSLRIVRDALERYRTLEGEWPGQAGTEAGFRSDLATYLRKIPDNPYKGTSTVDVQTSGLPLSFVGGSPAWRYDNQTGQFIANSNGTASDGLSFWEL